MCSTFARAHGRRGSATWLTTNASSDGQGPQAFKHDAATLTFNFCPPQNRFGIGELFVSMSPLLTQQAPRTLTLWERIRDLPLANMTSVNTAAIFKGPEASKPRQHSTMQLWLQDMLKNNPIAGPMARSLAGPTAVDATSAKAKVRAQRTLPKNLAAEDRPLWDMFVEMDSNGDGCIDHEELRTSLFKMGLPCSPSYIAQMMSQIDNGSATVTWEQFKHYVRQRDKEIDEAFREFDVDGNGEISARELGRAMSKAGLPTTGRGIAKVMDVLDKDDNDSISYDEFRRFACLVPQWKGDYGSQAVSFAGFLSTAPAVVAAGQRPRANLMNDPVQRYMVFDMALRASMVGAMALVVLVATREE